MTLSHKQNNYVQIIHLKPQSNRLLRSSGHHDIVDLQNHTDALSRKGDGTCRHKGRLYNVSLVHVFNCALSDIQASIPLVVVMSVSQLGHENNWV